MNGPTVLLLIVLVVIPLVILLDRLADRWIDRSLANVYRREKAMRALLRIYKGRR